MSEWDSVDKPSTFNLMQALGITNACVAFSGGNDEGGVDAITIKRAGGEVEEFLDVFDSWNGTAGNDEQRLSELLQRPVYQEYSSFAGDFYVNGTVVWDLAQRTVRMDGYETVPSEAGFGRDL